MSLEFTYLQILYGPRWGQRESCFKWIIQASQDWLDGAVSIMAQNYWRKAIEF